MLAELAQILRDAVIWHSAVEELFEMLFNSPVSLVFLGAAVGGNSIRGAKLPAPPRMGRRDLSSLAVKLHRNSPASWRRYALGRPLHRLLVAKSEPSDVLLLLRHFAPLLRR